MSFNLKEEIIDGHLVTAETKKLWAVEMDLVCQKHNLRIWADGGTLLGAVRHKGFIPWDDDMDFVMFRDDYNKLLEIGPKEFSEPYFFQSIYTDNTWGGMAKLRRSDTAMIDSMYKEIKDRNSGIFVDIIVLDGIPDNKLEFKKEYNWISVKRRLLTRYGVYKPNYSSLRAALRTIMVKLYFIFHDYYKLQQKVVNVLSRNKIINSKYCTLIDLWASSRIDFNKNIRECAWYKETIEMPFCDMMLPIPKEYDKLLRSQFGDYMTPSFANVLQLVSSLNKNMSYKKKQNH